MKKEMTQASIGVLIVALFAMVSMADFEDVRKENQTYCEMIAIWKADAERGLPPIERAGWPPFEGEEQCRKETSE